MVTLGRPGTRELADGWTVVTTDGVVRARTGSTPFAITEDGPWVLTGRGRRARASWPSSVR